MFERVINQIMVGGEDLAWQDYGECVGLDSDLFFPSQGSSSAAAQAICQGSAVREECLEYALRKEKHGIWGGMTERERRRLKKQRNAARLLTTT